MSRPTPSPRVCRRTRLGQLELSAVIHRSAALGRGAEAAAAVCLRVCRRGGGLLAIIAGKSSSFEAPLGSQHGTDAATLWATPRRCRPPGESRSFETFSAGSRADRADRYPIPLPRLLRSG